MTTEKHDPWALLREARDQLVGVQGMGKVTQTIARIDAALAEPLDSTTPVVEWKADAFGTEYVRRGNMLSMVTQTLDGNWGWETRTEGYADTEAEAKSAAIAAARGLK
jgi:hypothetical protein